MESFTACDKTINTVAISTNGFLYTTFVDGKIKVCVRQVPSTAKRPNQHNLVAMLEGHHLALNGLALTSNGALILYSRAYDKAIVVWEREDSSQHAILVGALRGHTSNVVVR